MSHQRILCIQRFLRQTTLVAALCAAGLSANAQEFQAPTETAEQTTAGGANTDRIVDGRPKLHPLKRSLHPFSWFDAGVKPILRLAESQAERFVSPDSGTPRRSGVRLSIDKAGSSSGIGPEVTPFFKDFLGTGIDLKMPLLVTYKRYESYRFIGTLPLIADEDSQRLSLELNTGYRSRPSDSFFGPGNDSRFSDRTRYRSVIREAGAAIHVGMSDVWKTGVAVSHRNVGITKPYVSPSAQVVFDEQVAPGLTTGAKLLSTSALLERDTTHGEAIPSSGGLHRVEVSLNEGSGRGDFSYWKYRYEFEHAFSLTDDGGKVLAFRGALETNQEKGGSKVPFFDYPYVGGRSTLRGFDGFRFMDKSAVSVGAEYRYRIWRAFDLGVFVDQGQVGPEIGDFDLDRFHTGYGARFIVRPKSDFAISIDVGRSREAWKAYIDFSSTF